MDFDIKYEDGYLLCTLSSVAETEKFSELFDAMLMHEKWIPCSYWIYDHSRLDVSDLTSGEVRQITKICIKRR